MENEKTKLEIPTEMSFSYIKSKMFRVVHADGSIGNLTPKNDIFMSFYNERHPIPDKLVFDIADDGKLGKEKVEQRVSSTDGILREMEVGVVMDLAFARDLSLWLTKIIQQAEENQELANRFIGSESNGHDTKTV